MATLFTIRTDRAVLNWNDLGSGPSASSRDRGKTTERLALRGLRPGAEFGAASWRPGSTMGLKEAAPALLEQRDYRVVLRAVGLHRVAITHRDPVVQDSFDDEEPGRVDGIINFRSQIGVSTFRVLVDEVPEFEFDVEVFPTKLDYRSDYEEILADVQACLTGLAFEYLRATWQGGRTTTAPAPTQIEWLTLLRHVADDLETALRQISLRPVRGLVRAEEVRRADQVRHVDSGVRAYLRRQVNRGLMAEGPVGLTVPGRITERRARPTLDTAEHRWLATQVDRIRRRVAQLSAVERVRHVERPSSRGAQAVAELRQLEVRTERWSRLEPIQSATDFPPAGFASLQLLTAPGYREAYRACMVLSLGLRIEGGPLQLSVKDLNLLYEYWCYLALIRVVSEETKTPIDSRSLLEVRERGLSVRLRQGQESKSSFALPDGRRLTVRYNPLLSDDALVRQRPDLLLTVEDPDWPTVHLVLDAKYRLDPSEEYVQRYQSAGPPEDALNAMHRYRDAILEEMDGATRRTVVQAAALFPLRVEPEKYQEARLWRALKRVGVGAIPLLPGHDQFLRAWLRSWLGHGGWDLADHAIDHCAIRHAMQWRKAAAEPVLVGALRGEDPASHLTWIRETRRYYTPNAKGQARLLAARGVALYEPAAAAGHDVGRVRFGAEVRDVRVVRRSAIATPWMSRLGTESEEHVLYELGPVEPLLHPILNEDDLGRGRRIPARMWSSRLALERARRMVELFLETEPEWRLYEELRARAIPFELRARPPKLQDQDDLRGRVLFVLGDTRTIAWMGSGGFILRELGRADTSVASVNALMANLRGGR